MPRRQTHQGLKFPTENILTHTTWEAAEKLLKEMAAALRLKTQEGVLMKEDYMDSLARLLVRAVVERAARTVSEAKGCR